MARTPFEDPAEAPRQGRFTDPIGELAIDPEYAPAIDGMRVGDAYLVLWFAHEADRTLLRIDRNGGRGVFSTRSQDRPNPIGATTVELVDIEGTTLTCSGVDMISGTPILDIKSALHFDPPE